MMGEVNMDDPLSNRPEPSMSDLEKQIARMKKQIDGIEDEIGEIHSDMREIPDNSKVNRFGLYVMVLVTMLNTCSTTENIENMKKLMTRVGSASAENHIFVAEKDQYIDSTVVDYGTLTQSQQ